MVQSSIQPFPIHPKTAIRAYFPPCLPHCPHRSLCRLLPELCTVNLPLSLFSAGVDVDFHIFVNLCVNLCTPAMLPLPLLCLVYDNSHSNEYFYYVLGTVFGEGNGTPLQYSCLENPVEGGAWWWAAVHGVARVGHDWATSLSLFTFMHWRRKWQPTPVSLPGESQGRGSLVGCRLWGRTESDTTEAT